MCYKCPKRPAYCSDVNAICQKTYCILHHSSSLIGNLNEQYVIAAILLIIFIFIMVLPMASHTFKVLYKSTPGVMYKNVSAIVGRGKITVPFVFLATYVSAVSLAAIASEADHFEVVNIGLHSQMLATTLTFSNEIIVPVPLEVVIPLLTLQSLKQLALSHNVVDVFGCQKKQDILDVIRQHQKTCTCENVVTVFQKCTPRKKKRDGETYWFSEIFSYGNHTIL